MKGSLRLSTTNLIASRHVVVHVHHESTHNFHTRFHTTSTHWSSCPHFLMVASTPILYPETWASLSAPSESTILARDTPVALDSPSMRDSPFVEYPAAPHTHTAHARVSLLWPIPSIGASLAWHHTANDGSFVEMTTFSFQWMVFHEIKFKPASTDLGCIYEQLWKEQCRKKHIKINRTNWYCFRICIKWVITIKNCFCLHYAHVMVICTYVPTKVGPLLKLQYPFGSGGF